MNLARKYALELEAYKCQGILLRYTEASHLELNTVPGPNFIVIRIFLCRCINCALRFDSGLRLVWSGSRSNKNHISTDATSSANILIHWESGQKSLCCHDITCGSYTLVIISCSTFHQHVYFLFYSTLPHLSLVSSPFLVLPKCFDLFSVC